MSIQLVMLIFLAGASAEESPVSDMEALDLFTRASALYQDASQLPFSEGDAAIEL